MSSEITMCDFTELKSLNNPPEIVKLTATATLALLGFIGTIDVKTEKDPRMWKFFRTILNHQTMVTHISKFDAKMVTNENVQIAKKMIAGLTKEKVCNVSKATCGLYLWVCKAIRDAEC